MEVDLDPRSNGIEGQGQTSKLRFSVYYQKLRSDIKVTKVKGQVWRSYVKVTKTKAIIWKRVQREKPPRSRSEFKVTRSWSLLEIKVRGQGHLGQIMLGGVPNPIDLQEVRHSGVFIEQLYLGRVIHLQGSVFMQAHKHPVSSIKWPL